MLGITSLKSYVASAWSVVPTSSSQPFLAHSGTSYMPMVTRSNWAAFVEISVVTLSRTWFSGSTSKLSVMPGCDDSKSPLSCSRVFICGLPTMATLTVPVAAPAAGLAAAAVAVVGTAAAVVGLAAAGAAGTVVGAGAWALGAQAAAKRLTLAAIQAARDHRTGRD